MRGTYPVSVPKMGRRLSHVDISGISGLTVWLESTWGVVRDSSGNVERWNDRSGRGNHAVQATSAARPVFGTLAGRPVIQTTKAARFLAIPSSADYEWTTDGLSAYCVASKAQAASAASQQYHVGAWDVAPSGQRRWLMGLDDGNNTAGGVYASETGTNADRRLIVNEDCSIGSARVMSIHLPPSGLQIYGQAGGTRYGPTAIAGQRVTGAPSPLCIGRIFVTDTTLGADCDFIALLVFRRMVSTAEDVAIRNYLAQQHGAT